MTSLATQHTTCEPSDWHDMTSPATQHTTCEPSDWHDMTSPATQHTTCEPSDWHEMTSPAVHKAVFFVLFFFSSSSFANNGQTLLYKSYRLLRCIMPLCFYLNTIVRQIYTYTVASIKYHMVEYVQNFLHRCSNKRVVEDNAGDVPEAALSVCRPVGSIPHVRVVTHFLNCGFEYLFGRQQRN